MNSIQRIAKNSLVPMATQVVNRLADAGFAIYVLRMLGSEGAGRYEFAIFTWLLVKTISDFGLGVLATREVARAPETAGRWLGGGILLRLLVLLALAPLVGLVLIGFLATNNLSTEAAVASLLLVLSIAPAAPGDAATAIFNGRERMDLPAYVTLLSTGLKIALAGAALAAGFGVIGLAAAPLIVNAVSSWVLWRLARPLAPVVDWWPGAAAARAWLVLAWPLLLNSLLVNLYFRLDTYVLQAAQGEDAVGLYAAAYKFVNFTLIVPPYLTLALFPGLVRQAARDPAELRHTLRLATGYLVILALPAAVATTALADTLIWLLAGPDFLPGSAEALRALIWFLPLSYVNGLVQYVLIALNRQRLITSVFAATVAFNLIANLLLIPPYGYLGAAAVTVASEAVLLAPLLVMTRRALGPLELPGVLWRPAVAMVAMAVATIATWTLGNLLATVIGGGVYLVVLLMLGAWGEEERRLARALLGRTGAA